ncbi:complement regulator-acquiring protein [Borreliella andersonii]|uniref:complement regulator-acquiring protein n=1 Tax=Borrelia andersonii TaxID=42109 RepID=UPI0029309FB5|nr:complement regulator-acquiring protein [Borreliella andersonii]WNY70074.1 complement regulator-acquiring protein [Borreliella andersonii]
MTKINLNTTKLNIITTILTLICISCAPVNKTKPKVNENTKLKKGINSEKSTNLEKSSQNFEDTPGDFKSSYQKSSETTASKLKAISKELEDQKNQHNIQMAKMTKEESSLFDPYIAAHGLSNHHESNLVKKMLYSSLGYKKENIETLKEILETLVFGKSDPKIPARFLHRTAGNIELQLENCLQTINEKLNTQSENSKGDLEELLMQTKYLLQLKERFKKTLNETLEAYRKNTNNMKDNEQILEEHFSKYYQELDTLKPIY